MAGSRRKNSIIFQPEILLPFPSVIRAFQPVPEVGIIVLGISVSQFLFFLIFIQAHKEKVSFEAQTLDKKAYIYINYMSLV